MGGRMASPTGRSVMELVLIRGLPGSGKSTLAKAMPCHVHLEADMYFVHPYAGYVFEGSKVGAAHGWCQSEARRMLEARRPTVVSNTFTQKWEMQPYLDMAASLNIPVRVIEAKGNFKNVHGVPEDAIQRMRDRWEEIESGEVA